MKINQNYHEMIKIKNIEKLRAMQKSLPDFCTTFFRGINDSVNTRTCVAYAYDLQVFFHYVKTYLLKDAVESICDIPLSYLDQIRKLDLEDYMDYLSYYESDNGIVHTNDERGKARKLSTVKRMYLYFYDSELIKTNPASLIRSPKLHDKAIIKLDPNEVAELLDVVEFGSNDESKHQKHYHDITMLRDLALLTLLLGTGIRVSECVGLDIKDVDFDNNAIKVTRKGGNEARVYFGTEVEDALRDYIEQRKHTITLEGHENALFLSMQNRRISVRAVENLVKKYATQVTSLKKITPHKLRSTYGTNLYQESNDIYLVASVLGHKDVNTTRKHYASMEEETRRKAAKIVKLRKD